MRAYLYALSRGARAEAENYLASGSGAPSEDFMANGGRIADVRSSPNGDGTYRVIADVRAASGEYYITFTVAALPQGMLITNHFYIKPH